MTELESQGWAMIRTGIEDGLLNRLRETVFAETVAGTRCLLDQDSVRETANRLRALLVQSGFLSPGARAIQAISFDKTAVTNWKVGWHQDLMFPLAGPATAPGYETPSVKEGVHYARPPRGVLEELLAVRLHLDVCDETNGPLRIVPGSHRAGILKSGMIPEAATQSGSITCLAQEGEALLMKPLLLHASSPAKVPKHRRVLHVVYHSGQPVDCPWYRAI